jgi:penicillin amidase/acyl-homoserine-lactone acylase
MGDVRPPLQYFRLNKAANLEEWRAAMRLQAIPSLNYVYADEKGNIGYIYNGSFPVRKEGLDWQGTLPGDRSDLIWRSYLPFDKEPQIWNPPSGFVFNSNNTPFHATAPEDDLKPEDFSPTLGIQTDMTNRAWRAMETYGADRRITNEAFHAYKYDLAYSLRSPEAQAFNEVLAINPGSDTGLRQAHDILQRWNLRTDVSNRAAALAILTIEPVIRARLEGKAPKRPIDALRDAMLMLKTHFGRIDPEWGNVNRLRRGALSLAIDGGPDIFRGVYGEPQPDGTLTAMAGDTFVMFVTWDQAGQLTSESIHQFGSATLDRNSPHYADQAPLFVAMQTKAVLFTQAQLAGHVEADYRPGSRPGRR